MDSMRALAALLVIAYHIAFYSGALFYGWTSRFTSHLNVGVSIFFGISGFLLYRPFLAARFGAPQRSHRAYARNRMLRIVPAYWTALTAAAIYPGLSGAFTGDWAWYYGFAQIYTKRREVLGLPVAWSLAVEMSFYALLPLYALAMRKIVGSRAGWIRLELAGLAALCITCTALQRASPLAHLTTIVATFDWFAVGMALAVLSVGGAASTVRVLVDHPLSCWICAAVIYLALSQWYLPSSRALGAWGTQQATDVLYATITGLLLIPAALTPARGRQPQRVVSLRALGWLGLVSYGLYLYHLPVLIAATQLGVQRVLPGHAVLSYAIVALPATVVLAAASYYLIERPALRFKARPGSYPEKPKRRSARQSPPSEA